jgi:hypothetical protein
MITSGVECAAPGPLQAFQVEQYFKEGRALRTETTVNDTRDFFDGRRVTRENWEALLRIGHEGQRAPARGSTRGAQCAPGARTLERVVLPSREDGQSAPGLRFGDPRVLALLSSLCSFSHLLEGLTNRSLRALGSPVHFSGQTNLWTCERVRPQPDTGRPKSRATASSGR